MPGPASLVQAHPPKAINISAPMARHPNSIDGRSSPIAARALMAPFTVISIGVIFYES
jgi:hypothetical protein